MDKMREDFARVTELLAKENLGKRVFLKTRWIKNTLWVELNDNTVKELHTVEITFQGAKLCSLEDLKGILRKEPETRFLHIRDAWRMRQDSLLKGKR